MLGQTLALHYRLKELARTYGRLGPVASATGMTFPVRFMIRYETVVEPQREASELVIRKRCTGIGLRRVGGFTLIEVAVVVAIVALIMTLGLGFLNTQIESNAYSITKRRADIIKDALIAHLGAHRRLPCPIVPAGTPVTGEEPPMTGTPLSCPSAFGVVPYATLGLSREIAEDGWGNMFSYQVYFDSPVPSCPGVGANWSDASCFGEGKRGGLRVNDGTTEIASSVIAVVVSHGPNGAGAYVVQGTRNANPAGGRCEEAQNAHIAIGGTCPALPAMHAYVYYKGERPEENDDVVVYLTAAETLQTLARQGSIKSAVGQAMEDLQAISELALVTKFRDVASDPTQCAATVSVAFGKVDPWGNPYQVDGTGLPICIYSTAGGTGSPPVKGPNTCTCDAPTICRSIDKAAVNAILLKAALPECP